IDGGAWLTPRSSAGGGRQPINPSYLGWETKVQARRDAFFTEAQVTVKRRRYNRLHHHPRDTDDAAETTRNTKGSQTHHQAKPWLLSLEIRERSPTSSSDSSFRLMGTKRGSSKRPTEETEKAGERMPDEKRQRHTSFRQASEADLTQNQRKTNPRSTNASCKQTDYHHLALSPETLYTHPNVHLVTGSGRNPVRTRERGARRRERIGSRGAFRGWRSAVIDSPPATGEASRRPPKKMTRGGEIREIFSHLSL
ncbi:LOW QUALITY PROTEIN: hypothetical protein HID58_012401, partial [Brassica napus]